MTQPLGIAVCRQASDYLKPGYRLGFSCKICSKELQVSPMTAETIRIGDVIPLCNACGFAMQRRLEDAGSKLDVVMTPEAQRQLEALAEELKRALDTGGGLETEGAR